MYKLLSPQDVLGGPLFRVALSVVGAIAFGVGLYRGASKVGRRSFKRPVLKARGASLATRI
jgi:hypothetical protein